MSNINEMLYYLENKRRAVFPAEKAEQVLIEVQNRFSEAEQQVDGSKTIAGFGALLFVVGLFTNITILFFIGLAIGVIGLLMTGSLAQSILEPVTAELQQAQENYNQAINHPSYQQESLNFPPEFYNLYSINRLMSIVQEGWASSLPEAYQQLKNELHQEQMLNVAIETRDANIMAANYNAQVAGLMEQQVDLTRQTRNAARVSAATNVYAANKARKISKNMKK